MAGASFDVTSENRRLLADATLHWRDVELPSLVDHTNLFNIVVNARDILFFFRCQEVIRIVRVNLLVQEHFISIYLTIHCCEFVVSTMKTLNSSNCGVVDCFVTSINTFFL
jgi:hypothetical protein